MTYEGHVAPGETPADDTPTPTGDHGWPLWEVFVRQKRGLAHTHSGSLHAPDAETAVQNARDVYTRRMEGVSVWVVPSTEIHASDPFDSDWMFETFGDKPYRHPTFYTIPDEVGHM